MGPFGKRLDFLGTGPALNIVTGLSFGFLSP